MAISNSLCVDSTFIKDSTNLNMSSYKATSSKTLAQLLDQKFNTDKSSSSTGVSTTSQRVEAATNTPRVEKVWTPLSESTPMGLSQPKDILRAKSRLSKLSEFVHTEDDSEDLEDSAEEPDSSNTKDDEHERTPSKPQRSSPKAPSKKSSDVQSAIEELNKFKDYVSQLENGSSIIESFDSKSNGGFIVLTKNDFQNLKEEIKQLKLVNESQARTSNSLKEEINVLTSLNKGLKDDIALKESSFDNFKRQLNQTEKELKLEVEKTKNNEESLTALKLNLNKIRGDENTIISTQRFPSLSEVTSNNISLYDDLELPSVDKLSQIEAQNLIKNVLINLHIPLRKTQESISDIARNLENREILTDFANKTHKLLYETNINLSVSPKERGNHHLEQCTKKMYGKIEMMHGTQKRNY